MLDVIIEGDSHPKKVTITSDDRNAENVRFGEVLEEWEFPDLAQQWNDTEQDEDGLVKLEVPTEAIGDMIDLLEGEFFNEPAYQKLEAMRKEAMDAAEAALQGQAD